MDFRDKITDFFNTPKGRQITILGGIGILAMVLVLMLPETESSTRQVEKKETASKDMLTGDGTDDLQVETLSVRSSSNLKKIEELEKRLSSERAVSLGEKAKLEKEITRTREEMMALRRERKKIYDEVAQRFKADMDKRQDEMMDLISSSVPSNMTTASIDGSAPEDEHAGSVQQADSVPFLPATDSIEMPLSAGANVDLRGEDVNSPKITLKVVGDEDDEDAIAAAESSALLIPAGSILSGVLVSGMDVSTSSTAKRDPYPALVRIKLDAILPNRFTMDVRECHLVISGYGELSSERAFMRAEKLSCIREDGAVVETPIEAWGTGEDGKAGVRGRVVMKNGSLLARGLAAGFLSGISDATKPQAIQGIQTTPGADSLFQAPATSDVMKAGAYGGISSSMDRLAEYYIEMAEEIFPVIEIGAGRQIDFIISSGVTLNFDNTGRG